MNKILKSVITFKKIIISNQRISIPYTPFKFIYLIKKFQQAFLEIIYIQNAKYGFPNNSL